MRNEITVKEMVWVQPVLGWVLAPLGSLCGGELFPNLGSKEVENGLNDGGISQQSTEHSYDLE